MRTVHKALAILDLFTEAAPRLRLRDVVAATGHDRATAHRMLRALQEAGYVQQSPSDKSYTLGPTVLRLARTREAILPTEAILTPILASLSERTGETSHATLIAGAQVANVAVHPGLHPNRVHVDAGGTLALNATASGLACLVWGSDAFRAAALSEKLERYSDMTATDYDGLAPLVRDARQAGHTRAGGSYDAEVLGIAAPIFGPDGSALGAIATASPLSRATPEIEAAIARATMQAALEASRQFAGVVPQNYPFPSEESIQ